MSHRQLKERSSLLPHLPLSLPQSRDNVPLYCALVKMRHPSLLTLHNKERTQGLHGEEGCTRDSLLKTVHGCASGHTASSTWRRDEGAGPHNHTLAGNIRDLLRSSSPHPCSSRVSQSRFSLLCIIRFEYVQGWSLHNLWGT